MLDHAAPRALCCCLSCCKCWANWSAIFCASPTNLWRSPMNFCWWIRSASCLVKEARNSARSLEVKSFCFVCNAVILACSSSSFSKAETCCLEAVVFCLMDSALAVSASISRSRAVISSGFSAGTTGAVLGAADEWGGGAN